MVPPGQTEIEAGLVPGLSRSDPARDARGSPSLERAAGPAAGPVRRTTEWQPSHPKDCSPRLCSAAAEQGPLAATSARPRCARRAARGGLGTDPGSHVVKTTWRTRWV